MKTYAEKLKDPRWQRKRLEIMERDGFKCRICGDETTTLHVHHIRYLRGREPWEYREFYFVTLCENCHETEEREIKACGARSFTKTTKTVTTKTFVSNEPELTPEEMAEMNAEPSSEELDKFFASLKSFCDNISTPHSS